MIEKKYFLNKDLLLQVSLNYDTTILNLNKYESFLDVLCVDREYQKDAIRETIRYFLGGEYKNTRELAMENYYKNYKLREKYTILEDLYNALQIPEKLSCSIDHATATGKSFVMYGIARIMLAEGYVDQVLVLCPSNTIEQELTDKFKYLSANRTLKDLLPTDAKIVNPRIINASTTILEGDICIENIHATYMRTKSAIEDSLVGKGDRTLILNDEAHHLMSPSDTALKKWKEFLTDPIYGFKFIVNLSGTCYIDDEYFTDVIHRLSLKDAIENRFIKSIRYVAEDTSISENEKLQKIYDNHLQNKEIKYTKVKPITILVTKNIASCKRLYDRLIDFIAGKEAISKHQAERKVLIVTSANEHKHNIPVLQRVDDKESPIEWITSVSMLSEGWDVENVLQIVPHEERAFNSKLLIAQVLGRGLRIPKAYKGEQPIVTIFNHDRWSSGIKHLVDEVLEIEKRIYSYPVIEKHNYNFDLHNIDYKRSEEVVEYTQEDTYNLLQKGYIVYSTQEENGVEKSTTYVTAISGDRDVKKTFVGYKVYTVDEVVNEVVNKLKIIDMDLDTNYSNEFNRDKVRKIIEKSLEKLGQNTNKVSESNFQKTLQAFMVVYRKAAKSLRFKIDIDKVVRLKTGDMKKTSISLSSLTGMGDGTIFWDDDALKIGDLADRRVLKELVDDYNLPKKATLKVDNKYNFKTPQNLVFASFEPERKFILNLTDENNSNAIDAWIKSPDMGFYSIDYSWRKGEHPKQGKFNPDYFIKIGGDIIVVEIKADGDVSDENKAKLRYTKGHFRRINSIQDEQKYCFKLISPISYDLFFKSVREKTYTSFISEIEAQLEEYN